jgi:hypothetical protein
LIFDLNLTKARKIKNLKSKIKISLAKFLWQNFFGKISLAKFLWQIFGKISLANLWQNFFGKKSGKKVFRKKLIFGHLHLLIRFFRLRALLPAP